VSGAGPDQTGPELVLYRCPTPTDVLCPCGAVARRLRKLGIPHRVERVPYRRSGRPEIIELTGQDRVPLLIDGEEIIHDSKRILEYLEWRYAAGAAPQRSGDDGRSTESG
jgi:glutathione S-transferase